MFITTARIIMIAKCHFDEETERDVMNYDLDTIDCVRWWISGYTSSALRDISDGDVKNYIREAFMDFVQHSKQAEGFMRNFYNKLDKGYDEMHAYMSAFRMVKVKDNKGEYMDGFTADNTRPVTFKEW